MAKSILPLLLALVCLYKLNAQTQVDSFYTLEKLEKSLSFAQLTFGGDLLGIAGGTVMYQNQKLDFGATYQPRLTFGGLHFWGHADFFVTFPIGLRLNNTPDFADKFKNVEGLETGFKIYPFALKPGKLRPYVGMSFQSREFSYENKGGEFKNGAPKFHSYISPIQLGLTYCTSKFLFSCGMRYNWKNQFDYYYAEGSTARIRQNPVNFSISILRYFDSDIGMATPKQVDQENIKLHLLKKYNRLSSWYLGIGPSAALQMSKSAYIQEKYPFLNNQQLNSTLIPDLTFGYYFSKLDANVGASSRIMFFKAKAFDTDLRILRGSISIEAYKFLFDYHGFVPYVGPMLSYESLILRENGKMISQQNKPALGIVFGWDIRVTQTGTSLLRTNLRYTPNLSMTVDNKKLMFDHLEFNFIQWVHFFGRGKVYSNHRTQKNNQ